jgi:type IV pilus assembly protein PilA
MTCSQCGNEIPAGASFCPSCGQAARASSSAVPAQPAIPGGSGTPATSGKAIASLVFGLLPLTLLSAIPAIVFGHIALSEIKKSAGRLQGRGLAIAGLVLGYFSVAIMPFILIIAAIAIPNLLRARIAANEASAVNEIRTVNAAEVSFNASRRGYTCSLSDLQEFAGDALATGQRHGYILELSGCESEASGGPNAHYQVTARPQHYNRSGMRAFCSDEGGVIRFDTMGSPEKCLSDGVPLQ